MQNFKNVEEFYSENSARRRSPEADYGVHWKLEGWPNSFRVSYVRDTGEIYAVQQGPMQSGILPTGEIIIANGPEATRPEATSPEAARPETTGPEEGPVLLLGHFPWQPGDLEKAGPRNVYYRGLEKLLEGWPERSVQPNGLVWIIEKLGGSAPSVVHIPGSTDDAEPAG